MQHALHHTGSISLRDVLPNARFHKAGDIRVISCCADASRCRPGDLYVALVDAERDGHDDVFHALEQGATAVLAERMLPVDIPVCMVDDTRQAYGLVCQGLVNRPADEMHMIGVTGTSGKTTTGILIRSVLEAAGRRVGLTGTLEYCDGFETASPRRTTPPPPQLAHWMARMSANGCSHAVIEMSSRALAQRYASGVEFDAAVLTNIRRDHIDFHGSVGNYRKAKSRLLQQLRPDGFAVINVDDPVSCSMLSDLSQPVLSIGMHSPAELTAAVLERHKSEQTFLLVAGNQSVPVRTRMIGDHFVYHCLAAAAVGLVLDIDLTTVVKGLEAVEHVPGRLERLECGQPFGVFVDYARTPGTLAAALKTLRQVTEGRLICVYGADSRRDPEMRPLLGRVVERGADLGMITSDNPRHESPLRIAHDLLDGYQRPGRAHLMPDRVKAIHWALREAQPGDTVLIAGKGNEDFQVIGDVHHHFDDGEVVRNWLYDVGAKIDYATQQNHILKFARPLA